MGIYKIYSSPTASIYNAIYIYHSKPQEAFLRKEHNRSLLGGSWSSFCSIFWSGCLLFHLRTNNTVIVIITKKTTQAIIGPVKTARMDEIRF